MPLPWQHSGAVTASEQINLEYTNDWDIALDEKRNRMLESEI